MRAHLFIGPTAEGIPPALLSPFQRHPPVEANSIHTLRRHEAPGTIILVDGNLEPGREISEKELLEALHAGWTIHGLASVGALKAAALYHLGLRGHGFIARYARLFPQQAQDAVAALYFNTPPYFAASEPLIELRMLLRLLRRRGKISHRQERQLAAYLTAAPLEDRTFESIARLHPSALTIPPEAWRIKRRDLLSFLSGASASNTLP